MYSLDLLLNAVAFGLILDDVWFIRSNIIDPGINEVPIYNATFPVVVLFVIIIIPAILLINHFEERKRD